MIIFDNYWPQFVKSQDFNKLKNYQFQSSEDNKNFLGNDKNFLVSWGENKSNIRHCVMETGFFWDALHFDKHGLYDKASFNFPEAKKIISSYNAPISWNKLNLRQKFTQKEENINWEGIVLIAQHPTDRSIYKVGTSKDYYNFIEKICSKYQSKIFIKKHPAVINNKIDNEILEGIALRYNCEIGNVNTSVIDNAEAVYLYNSTFVVDALMREKHVVEFAPGYFWQTGTVQYSDRKIPQKYKYCNQAYIDKFLDFLVWKYCVHKLLPMRKYAKLIRTFSKSNQFFPLPEECSYAHYLSTKLKLNDNIRT